MGRRLWRLIFLICCIAPLAACGNVVRSEKPLFSAADEVGAIPLRQGIWGGHEPDCVFDPSDRIEDWPSCAAGFVVGREGLKSPGLGFPVDRVAAGDPMIVQFAEEGAGGYTYAAVEVGARDRRGRATAIVVWPVVCSLEGVTSGTSPALPGAPAPDVGNPPPTASAPGDPPAVGEPRRRLFAGLVPDGQNCLAADRATVRDAARESRAADARTELRWLRAGRR